MAITKDRIKKLMEATGQVLTYEDNYCLQYQNPNFGEDIVFDFDENGVLCQVSS